MRLRLRLHLMTHLDVRARNILLMSIHDNPIYIGFLDALDSEKELRLIHFSTDPEETRFVEFYTEERDLIHRIELELAHNDFMKLYREFAQFHQRMKKSKMEDK